MQISYRMGVFVCENKGRERQEQKKRRQQSPRHVSCAQRDTLFETREQDGIAAQPKTSAYRWVVGGAAGNFSRWGVRSILLRLWFLKSAFAAAGVGFCELHPCGVHD